MINLTRPSTSAYHAGPWGQVLPYVAIPSGIAVRGRAWSAPLDELHHALVWDGYLWGEAMKTTGAPPVEARPAYAPAGHPLHAFRELDADVGRLNASRRHGEPRSAEHEALARRLVQLYAATFIDGNLRP